MTTSSPHVAVSRTALDDPTPRPDAILGGTGPDPAATLALVDGQQRAVAAAIALAVWAYRRDEGRRFR